MPPPPLFPSPLLPSLLLPSPLLPSLAPGTRLSASASGALPPQPPSQSINRIPSSSAMPPPPLLPSPLLPSLAPDTRLSAFASGALPPQPPSPSINRIPSLSAMPPPPLLPPPLLPLPLLPSPLLPSLAPDPRLSASAPGALPTQPPSPSINRIPSSSAMPPPPLFPSPLLPPLVPDTQLSVSASGALPPQPPSHSINRIPSSSAMPPPLLLPSPLLPSLAPDTRLSASAPGALPTQPPSPSTNSIPPAPHKPMMQRGGHVTVHIKMLHLDATQTEQIQQHYDVATNFHRLFSDELHSQQEASCMLQAQRLDLQNMDDLGNGWSKRWSKRHGKGLNVYTRMLLQCQCGTSTDARKTKDDQQQMAKGLPINEKPWLQKTPYDHTGCLAHLDLTYRMSDYHVQRITGVLSHNDSCLDRKMMRLPAIPLHDHVWQVALQQMMGGSSITSIQARNVELCHAKMYSDQATHDPRTTNVRYEILPSDSC
ncbi:hypothetical protein JB92DRAFT_3092071 [Gautieria morchelliformis]|nr:hypothetical protein JB92DRAFT_3092071 [Gautieria morchelliformis]